jgi:hypothetical protein
MSGKWVIGQLASDGLESCPLLLFPALKVHRLTDNRGRNKP